LPLVLIAASASFLSCECVSLPLLVLLAVMSVVVVAEESEVLEIVVD
jgi:hypothetical protein